MPQFNGLEQHPSRRPFQLIDNVTSELHSVDEPGGGDNMCERIRVEPVCGHVEDVLSEDLH